MEKLDSYQTFCGCDLLKAKWCLFRLCSSSGKFVELETQGAYQAIPRGQSLVWSTTWYLRKLPSTITATVGNQALVDWVRGVIQ